jgi:GTP-binding protein Era
MAEEIVKSGFVSIVGRPNSGKSTLLNRLVGQKISIVTPRPQTTRNIVRGIVTEPEGQIIFLDTPGIHKPLHRLNERMMRLMLDSLKDIDIVMLIVDASTAHGHGDEFALDMIQKVQTRRYLLLNKIDKIPKHQLLPQITLYSEAAEFERIVPISAKTGDGVDALKKEIYKCLPEGPLYYPKEQPTDQPERFLVSEVIREKLILMTREELPHATAIALQRFEEGEGRLQIFASIYVERESQKKIVIGRGGQVIKEVGTAARREIEALLDRRVHLELHVKVRKKWRDDEQVLKALGI